MGYLGIVEDVVLDLVNMVTQMEQDDQGSVFTKGSQEEYLINMPDHEHAHWLEFHCATRKIGITKVKKK